MEIDFAREIESITTQIIEIYNPEKIILFGSAVRGDLSSDSDVDFLIIKKDTPLYGAERIRELSRIIERNVSVDFLIYRSASRIRSLIKEKLAPILTNSTGADN